MRRAEVVGFVLALLLGGVLAGWAWSQEGAVEAPAGSEKEAAEAPAEGGEAVGETVKGYVCEIKTGLGQGRERPRAYPGEMKLTETAMLRTEKNVRGSYMLVDSATRATYRVNVIQEWNPRSGTTTTQYMADKYSWSDIDSLREIFIDSRIQDARMRMRDKPEEAAAQIAGVEAMKQAATMEPTEETKEIAGLACTKYKISQGDLVRGRAWVTKDIKMEVPIGKMLAYSLNEMMGGAGSLTQLDELDGFPVDVYVEFPMLRRERIANVSFIVEKITEADVSVAEMSLPAGARMEEPLKMRLGGGREREMRGPPANRPPGL